MAKRLYVGNLPYATTDTELEEYFSEAGEVTDVAIIYDRETGRSKGFGFVELANDEAAQDAIQRFDGGVFGGRTLKVAEARPAPPRSSNW